MKKYLAPSIEMNKFDVEDIITASGDLTTVENLKPASQTLYGEFANENTAAPSVVEFEW